MSSKPFIACPQYVWFKARQLEGGSGLDNVPIGAMSALRANKLFGVLPEEHSPGSFGGLDTTEMAAIDALAAPYGTDIYFRAHSLEEVRGCLFHGNPLTLTVPIFEQWYGAENGVIQHPGFDEAPIENHAVCIVGYNHDSEYLGFLNSWGAEWGNDGCGWLPYSYFEEYAIDVTAADFMPPYEQITKLPELLNLGPFAGFFFSFDHPVRGRAWFMSIYDRRTDLPVGWLHCFVGPQWLDCEEMYVAPWCRGQGLGHMLRMGLDRISSKTGVPFRYRLPLLDNLLLNGGLLDLAFALKFAVRESDVRWASHVLVAK